MSLDKSSPAPISPEAVSLGVHEEELAANIGAAPYAQPFTSLLVEAGVLPESLRTARMLPGITYGIRARQPVFERAELLTGKSDLIEDSLRASYFNPHLSLRNRAQTLTQQLAGKGRRRLRGNTFSLPSYVLENQKGRHLFIGGDESDLEVINIPVAAALSDAYRLGSLTVGGEVTIGEIHVNIGTTSLPRLVREIGQKISKLDISYDGKVQALKAAHAQLKKGESPEYRKYTATPQPGKKRK